MVLRVKVPLGIGEEISKTRSRGGCHRHYGAPHGIALSGHDPSCYDPDPLYGVVLIVIEGCAHGHLTLVTLRTWAGSMPRGKRKSRLRGRRISLSTHLRASRKIVFLPARILLATLPQSKLAKKELAVHFGQSQRWSMTAGF